MDTQQNNDIQLAIDALRKGGIILYPTDTVWGIGCDATNSEAVKRIYALKKRTDAKALITLVGSEAQLERTVECVPEVAWQLIEASDRPVTIVYDHGCGVAPELLAPDGSLGVRLTHDPFCVQLCQRLRRPIVSTSANISGEPTPTAFSQIAEHILQGVDYVCTSGRNKTNEQPSLVIKISDSGVFKILRG